MLGTYTLDVVNVNMNQRDGALFRDGDFVHVFHGLIISEGYICEHKTDKIEWITIHVVNGKYGEFVNPKNIE